jgi:hypothetical protein
MGLHHREGMSHRFTIVIEGIDDTSLADDIERTIRESFHDLALPGSWRVIVSPSPAGHRWDLRIHALNAQRTLSIAVPPSLLSSLIPSRLRESLDRPGHSTVEDRSARRHDLTRAV